MSRALGEIVGFEQIRGGQRGAYTRPAAYIARLSQATPPLSPSAPETDESGDYGPAAQIVPRATESWSLHPIARTSGLPVHVPSNDQAFTRSSAPAPEDPDGPNEGPMERVQSWLAGHGITGTRIVNNLVVIFLGIQLLRWAITAANHGRCVVTESAGGTTTTTVTAVSAACTLLLALLLNFVDGWSEGSDAEQEVVPSMSSAHAVATSRSALIDNAKIGALIFVIFGHILSSNLEGRLGGPT